jgi:hypothetical protein
VIVANELGLLQDTQREAQQTEPINVEASCSHLIPTILNGKIYPEAVNQPANCAIKRNPTLVNEVLINNFPSTGNLRLQTSNKSKSRVVILSDSHLR